MHLTNTNTNIGPNLAFKILASVQSAYTKYVNGNDSNAIFIAPVDEQEVSHIVAGLKIYC